MPGRPYPLPDFLPSIASTLIEALAGAKIGFCVMLDDGVRHSTIYQSEVAAEILGYPLDEVIGRDSLFCIAPEEIPALEERRRRALLGEPQPRTLDTIIVRKDGTRVPVEIGTCRVKIEGKDAVVAFLRDVSERTHAESALRRSEERFRRLIEALPEAIGVARDGKLLYVNPALAQMLGYDRAEDLVGHAMKDFVVAEEASILAKNVAEVEGGAHLAPHEYRIRRKDGTVTTIEASSIVIDFGGAPAILGVSRDITERKRMTEKMLHSDRMAIVGTLAAGVAHEINNPLAYISLILDRLRQELPAVPHEPRHIVDLVAMVDEARGGAERVAAIVRDLRMFSRTNTEGGGATELRRVLESSIKIAENEIRHRARLVVDIHEVPPGEASEARLGQVFLNLLVNAVQALPEGEPEKHEVRIVARVTPSTIEVDVADTGAGIAPEIRARIFEPFFTTKPLGVGTGLGLSICQSIVTSQGGSITVSSEVGKGTTFRVSLPRRAAPSRAPSSTPIAATHSRPLHSLRVLVIDDEPALASALERELEEDFEVATATSGHGALERLMVEDFDVILCDIMMPDLSGIDLHDELTRRKPGLEGRMVFMSGGAFTPRAARFFERGDIHRIEKPFDGSSLRALIRKAAQTKAR
jgi:PAS domain S-box-containing protein